MTRDILKNFCCQVFCGCNSRADALTKTNMEPQNGAFARWFSFSKMAIFSFHIGFIIFVKFFNHKNSLKFLSFPGASGHSSNDRPASHTKSWVHTTSGDGFSQGRVDRRAGNWALELANLEVIFWYPQWLVTLHYSLELSEHPLKILNVSRWTNIDNSYLSPIAKLQGPSQNCWSKTPRVSTRPAAATVPSHGLS